MSSPYYTMSVIICLIVSWILFQNNETVCFNYNDQYFKFMLDSNTILITAYYIIIIV